MTNKPRQKKTVAADYLHRNGFVYEKVVGETVELELREDVVQQLDSLVAEGKYVSRGDAIRSILREYVGKLDK